MTTRALAQQTICKQQNCMRDPSFMPAYGIPPNQCIVASMTGVAEHSHSETHTHAHTYKHAHTRTHLLGAPGQARGSREAGPQEACSPVSSGVAGAVGGVAGGLGQAACSGHLELCSQG